MEEAGAPKLTKEEELALIAKIKVTPDFEPTNLIEQGACMRDGAWRLRHLYFVLNKDGVKVLFLPWEEQQRLLNNLWYRNIILKARQRGFSTLIQMLMLDTCLFTANTQAAVIAQDQEAAGIIFRKIKFAYDNLPLPVKAENPLARDSASELVLANGSSLRVATSARSNTLQFLHVSEFGKICAEHPHKAREVLTGSLPAVSPSGLVFIESTAEGREGKFFDMTQTARAHIDAGTLLDKLQYKFHFAPWWTAQEYRSEPGSVVISLKDHQYFDRVEAEIRHPLDAAQRSWYVLTRDNQFSGDSQMMKQEYPSTPDESFEQSTEGVYYAEQLAMARRQDRIGDVPHDPSKPVNTFWDIGMNDLMVIWFHQRIGAMDHWINYFEASDEPFSYFTNHMQSLGYTWGTHYLPHDGNRRFQGADQLKTSVDILSDLGLRNIQTVERTPNVTIAIRQVRDAFPKYRFDKTRCADGLVHLGLYKKEWNSRLGVWSSVPRHDSHSNAADGLRQHAQVYIEPVGGSSTKRRRRGSGMAA
ncbi:MAG: hypothetical protein GC182_08935 [Rhodopseudomonas sp.]|nr:hypothetical protein [Rhodopseudomonas sp.]